jgi:protein SCO1/2
MSKDCWSNEPQQSRNSESVIMNQRTLRAWLALTTFMGMAGGLQAADQSGHAHRPEDTVRISTIAYRVPDLKLVRQDGKPVSLLTEMNDGRPVVLNFIFTSCEGVCPLMSQTFAEFQHMLGADSASVHMMSISIDPEQDTPARLRDYAKLFNAGPGWSYYTGSQSASIAAQQAFGVFRGDKMSHAAVTLIRSAPGASWRRLDGFVTPEDLLREYHALIAAR